MEDLIRLRNSEIFQFLSPNAYALINKIYSKNYTNKLLKNEKTYVDSVRIWNFPYDIAPNAQCESGRTVELECLTDSHLMRLGVVNDRL